MFSNNRSSRISTAAPVVNYTEEWKAKMAAHAEWASKTLVKDSLIAGVPFGKLVTGVELVQMKGREIPRLVIPGSNPDFNVASSSHSGASLSALISLALHSFNDELTTSRHFRLYNRQSAQVRNVGCAFDAASNTWNSYSWEGVTLRRDNEPKGSTGWWRTRNKHEELSKLLLAIGNGQEFRIYFWDSWMLDKFQQLIVANLGNSVATLNEENSTWISLVRSLEDAKEPALGSGPTAVTTSTASAIPEGTKAIVLSAGKLRFSWSVNGNAASLAQKVEEAKKQGYAVEYVK